MTTIEQRFWSKVERTDGCWLWTAGTFRARRGYGKFQAGHSRETSRIVRAHRFSYELAHGPIPPGVQVLHECDTPACVNPAHLRLGSAAENTTDMMTRNRHGSGARPHGESHPNAKLTDTQVAEIRARFADGETRRSLAAEFGITRGYVSDLIYRSRR